MPLAPVRSARGRGDLRIAPPRVIDQATASSAVRAGHPRADPTAACNAGTASMPLDHQPAGAPSGRASSAPPLRMPSARALSASRRRTASGSAPGAEAAPPSQRAALRAREERQPRAEQVERRDAGRRAPVPRRASSRPPRSASSSPSDVADRSARVSRAGDVVLGDRPPLGLVAVEQPSARPAAQHPAELPAEVEPIVDRRVHAGAPARGDPVGGVAHEEGAARAEALGELGREGERPHPLDAWLRVPRRPRRPGSDAASAPA